MTLDEIRASDQVFLGPADVAPVLRVSPQTIRLQAREFPEALGFPVICLGNKTRIPRKPFLAYIGEEKET